MSWKLNDEILARDSLKWFSVIAKLHADVVAKLKKTRSELDDPSMAVTIALTKLLESFGKSQ